MALYFIHSTCGAASQSGSIEITKPIVTHKDYSDLINDYEKQVDGHLLSEVLIISFNRIDK